MHTTAGIASALVALLRGDASDADLASEVCRGAVPAESLADAARYAPGAWVPGLDWSRGDAPVASARACLGSAAPTVVYWWAREGGPGAEWAHALAAGEATHSLCARAQRWLDARAAGRQPIESGGPVVRRVSDVRLAIGDPGLRTVTHDYSLGERLLGMHVDSHERRAIHERTACAWLWLMNVGRGTRHFLYVPSPLAEIARRVVRLASPQFVARANATDVGRELFARCDDVPIVRIALRPGDSYVAPVQNLIHDDSTLATTLRDETLRAFCEVRW